MVNVLNKEAFDGVVDAARGALHLAASVKERGESYARFTAADGAKKIATVSVLLEDDNGQYDHYIK